MKTDFGLGVALDIIQTKTMGKIAIIDNNIDTFNNGQLFKLNHE